MEKNRKIVIKLKNKNRVEIFIILSKVMLKNYWFIRNKLMINQMKEHQPKLCDLIYLCFAREYSVLLNYDK